MSQNPTGKKRRQFLKTAGASLCASGTFASTGIARGLTRAGIHARARRIYEQTNSAKMRERYLRKHNVPISTVEESYIVSKSRNDEEVSTSYLDEADLRIYFSMTEYNNDGTAWDVFLQWNWKNQDSDDWGEDPWDQAGIVYEDSHYYYNNDEVWYSDYHTDIASVSTTGEAAGIDFEFHDAYGDDGNNYYGEIVARYNKSNVSEERQIQAEYTHTYDGVIDSIQLGFPDLISVTFKNGGASWYTQNQHDGDPLVISPSDTTA
jgi:hypothetical protein